MNPFHFPTINLASKSPRRAELLVQMGVPFELVLPLNPSLAEQLEVARAGESPLEYVARVSMDKAQMMRAQIAHYGTMAQQARPTLCADTTVADGGRILGKPANREHAHEMLSALSGRTHQVHTAVVLIQQDKRQQTVVSSEVSFRDLTNEEIDAYIDSGEPFGKAGAYAIQGLGACFVAHLSGSFSAVKGLPIFEVGQMLKQF